MSALALYSRRRRLLLCLTWVFAILVAGSATSTASAASTGSTGAATPASFENRQPTAALTWVICINGPAPTANSPTDAEAVPGELRLVAFGSSQLSTSRWLPCNGQLLPISRNALLFSLIGTTYGGNGTSNFAIPDLRGRIPVGIGAGPGLTPRVLGEKGGEDATALVADNVSGLRHTYPGGTTIGGTTSPVANLQPFLALNLCVATTFTNDPVTELGWVRVFAFSLIPGGHRACDGSILPVAANSALYSRLGNAHGGNGTSTFALPDLRGRTLLGTGQSPGLTNRVLGATGGSESITLAAATLPAHTHTYQVGASTLTTDSTGTGDDQAHANLQPFTALNFSISHLGLYGGVSSTQPAIGEIRIWAGSAPDPIETGWIACEGQLVPISGYDALFSLIGTNYGGDGEESFNLPALGGRAPADVGQGTGLSNIYQLGHTCGAEPVALTTAHLPAHTHTLSAFPVFQAGATQTLTLVEDASVDLTPLLSAVDFDLGQTLTWTVVSAPAKCTLSGFPATASTAGNFTPLLPSGITCTPTADTNGSDNFSIQISDGTVADIIAFEVTISEVNDVPTAADDTRAAVNEDSGPLQFTTASLLANDSAGSADTGQTLSITAVSDAVGGTVTLSGASITFTPTPDFNGAASFVYTIRDDGTTAGAPDPLTATATVRFTINSVNDLPVLATNTRLVVSVQANISQDALRTTDADLDADLIYTVLSKPTYGVLSRNGFPLSGGDTFSQFDLDHSALSFRTNTSAVASDVAAGLRDQTDAFAFRVTDGAGGSIDPRFFFITIRNSPPGVPNDIDDAPSYTTEGAPAGSTTGITARASDSIGDGLAYSLVDDAGGRFAIHPSTGVVTVATDGLIDFETTTVYYITIQVADAFGATNSLAHSIGVLNAAPSAPSDSAPAANTVAPGALAGSTVGLVATASDPGGGTVTYSLTDDAGGRFAINASTGVVTLAAPGLIVLNSPASHAITVKAADPSGLFATTTFTIDVVAPTYATWRARVFTASQAALPAFSGLIADPDRDGISNLLEYAFALDPLAPDATGLPEGSLLTVADARYLALAYTRSALATDLTYTVQASSDLVTWSPTPILEVSVTDHGATETVLVRDTVPTDNGARRFLRVQVTAP